MIPALFAIFSGLILLYGGGELIVRSSLLFSCKAGISPLFTGLFILSFCTSLPECMVTFLAHLERKSGDLVMGNLVGSNLANLGWVLSTTALLRPISLLKTNLTLELLFSTLAPLLLIGCMGSTSTLKQTSGGLLLSLFICFVMVKWQRGEKKRTVPENFALPSLLFPLVKMGGGAFLLFVGGKLFLSGAVTLARLYLISESVIGIFLLALGTSLPEWVTSLLAAFKGENDLVLGNLLGSNLFNLLAILGTALLTAPLSCSSSFFSRDLPLLFGFQLLLWIRTSARLPLSRLFSLFLLSLYLLYAFLMA